MSSHTPQQISRGLWIGFLGIVIFSVTLPMTRLAVGTADAPQMSGVFIGVGRAVVAAVLSAIFLLATRAPLPRREDWLPLAITAGGVVFGFPLLTSVAMRHVEAVHAAVIIGTLPLATAAVGALLHRQRPSGGFWLCAAVGSALVVAFAILRSGSGGLSISPADLLLLAAVLCAAVGYAYGAKLSQRMQAEHVICWALVMSLPLTLPLSAFSWPAGAIKASAWWGFAYVGVFSMWLGFFAWYRGLALGGTVRVSQVQLVQPFMSMLFAVPLLGERLDAVTVGFGLAVIATVFIGKKCRSTLRRARGLYCQSAQAHDHKTRPQRAAKKKEARMSNMKWTQARRAEKMNPSVIREILKVTEKPGIISFAGGLPSPKTFPVSAFAAACEKVLREDGHAALQYAASEGYAPLREAVAAMLPWAVDPAQVLITTGSQQALDLVAKILIDEGSKILVETPTYLGALQAFTPMEPDVVAVASDDEGVDLADLAAKADGARFFYVLPNFQNPTGRTMSEARRAALSAEAARLGLPIVEDNPYGDLWFDTPPPPSLTSRNPEGCIYMGSFSKVLAPGLRLGFVVAPKALYPKLLQAKQAADLHSPGFNQRMVAEVMKDGFLDRHVPTIRALYKSQRDAMLAAMQQDMPAGVSWNTPAGGMFLWARLPEGMSAIELLPKAVERNVAFVPGWAFYADDADARTLRLSFVTASVEQINIGIASLAAAIREQMSTSAPQLRAA